MVEMRPPGGTRCRPRWIVNSGETIQTRTMRMDCAPLPSTLVAIKMHCGKGLT